MRFFRRGLRSKKEMPSSKMSPSRASLAAESAPDLPLMPVWPGTQTKTISFPFRISPCPSRACVLVCVCRGGEVEVGRAGGGGGKVGS